MAAEAAANDPRGGVGRLLCLGGSAGCAGAAAPAAADAAALAAAAAVMVMRPETAVGQAPGLLAAAAALWAAKRALPTAVCEGVDGTCFLRACACSSFPAKTAQYSHVACTLDLGYRSA